jgi:hypothetical protein
MKSSKIKRNSPLQSLLAGLCGVTLALCAGQPGFAQQDAVPQPAAVASSAKTTIAANRAALQPATEQEHEESHAAASAKPGGEGIRVHGHWVIDVLNPDGTLAEHRAFENSLVTGQAGDSLLIGLISGYFVPGDYAVEVIGNSGTTTNEVLINSYIVRSTSTNPGALFCTGSGASGVCYPTLTYSVNIPKSGPASFVLAGSFTASYSGTLNTVSTFYNVCENLVVNQPVFPPTSSATVSPGGCLGGTPDASQYQNSFTQTSVPTPMPIASGQLVQVTVTISFS